MSTSMPQISEEELRASILSFLDESKFAMLVTSGGDGFPMGRIMGFLHDDFTIWMTTTQDSLKLKQLRRDNKVTVLWKEPTPQFFQFLTLKGHLEILEDPETVKWNYDRYCEKYPMMRHNAESAEQMARRVALKITPVYLRAEGFGVRPPAILRSF